MDDSILALLASSSDDENNAGTTYRELPPHQVWSETALVDAWSAALGEFASASLSQSTGIPVVPLDRERQLLASPLWYAPLCPPSGSKSSPAVSKKRPAPATVEEREDEEGDHSDNDDDEAEHYDEEEEAEDDIVDNEVVEALLPPSIGPIKPTSPEPSSSSKRSYVHPSRLDHVKEHQPYIDPSEWQPVSTSTTVTTTEVTIQSNVATSEPSLSIPEPPAVENALPQDPALTASQTSQEALEKALNAWYTAGYAAALYHVRSGLVKP